MDETKELARFIVKTKYNDLSKEAIQKAKILFLDQLGCELAFSVKPWGKSVYEYIKEKKSSKRTSTVVKYGLKTDAEDAAFANAVFGHGFEMDDSVLRSTSHPAVAVIPAALAVGEMEKITGKQLITSIVVGYDVMLRIGSAARLMMERGFHTTGVIGPFGSAAAACSAHEADLDTSVNALGIAASECGGISEYTRSGGSVKRLHAGFAAQAGVKAAHLAGIGLTGPSTAIEGERGFCQAYADKYFIEDITEDLGSEFKILGVAIKPYCCCFAQHAVIDATSLIMAKNQVKPDDIAEIFVRQKHREALAVSAIVEPIDIVSAQFSGRFGLALRLIRGGNRLTDYSEANLKDPQILALAKKVKWIVDDELEKMPPESNAAQVTIIMKSGEIYEERVDYSKGTVQNPMTKAEILDKFRGLSSTVLPAARVNKIIEVVETLEDLDDVGKLCPLLVAKAS